MNKIETLIKNLVSGKSWKESGIITLVLFGILVALSSVFFAIIIAILKVVLLLAVIGMAIRTGYLAYPELKKKAQEMQN